MVSKIILEAEAMFEDTELREWVSKINKKLENLNERSKRQTIQIQELQKEIKQLKQ